MDQCGGNNICRPRFPFTAVVQLFPPLEVEPPLIAVTNDRNRLICRLIPDISSLSAHRQYGTPYVRKSPQITFLKMARNSKTMRSPIGVQGSLLTPALVASIDVKGIRLRTMNERYFYGHVLSICLSFTNNQ